MTDRRLAALCLWGGLAASMAANALMAPDVTAGATRMVAPVGQLLAFELIVRGHRVAGWRRGVISMFGASVWAIGAAVSYGHISAYVRLTEEAWIATVYPALADLIMTMGGLYLLWARPDEDVAEVEPAGSRVVPNPLPVTAPDPEAGGGHGHRLRVVHADDADPAPIPVPAPAPAPRPSRKRTARKAAGQHDPATVARARELLADGTSVSETAREVDVPRKTVSNWARDMKEERAEEKVG